MRSATESEGDLQQLPDQPEPSSREKKMKYIARDWNVIKDIDKTDADEITAQVTAIAKEQTEAAVFSALCSRRMIGAWTLGDLHTGRKSATKPRLWSSNIH
jgi:hypothetical protein